MEDVITEAPPPSRFLEEDLNTFTPPSPPHPPPSFHFPQTQTQTQEPLTPTLLIISLSPSSLSLFYPHLPPSTPLLATITLPNLPSPTLSSLSPHTLLLSFPSPLPSDLSHSLAKLILDRIRPQSLLVFDSISPRNHRGRLPPDEAVAFKLETSAERKRAGGEKLLEKLEYYPSGSVVDGLGAAILARCQMLNLRASLCVSWPEFDASTLLLIKGLLQNGVLRGVDLKLGGELNGEVLKAWRKKKDRVYYSELYI